ncbi:rhamnulokinase [bacterium]|nr:rhamnulokinase [bacterium]
MTNRHFIAVDLGAESGRTMVARFDGQTIGLSETHRFPNGYVRILGTMYWDTLRLWGEIKTGIGKSIREAGQARSVGVDTWGVDYGLVAGDGSLVGNPVHYRDRRTEGILEYAFSIVPQEEIYRQTGLQFLPFNTLFQLLAEKRQRGSAAFVGADKMLLVPDLLNSFLTGQKVAEYTIASTTQMLDAHRQIWDTNLLERFGIPTHLLPELVATGTKLGPVLPDVAREVGGSVDVVATAGHDTGSAVAAVPAIGGDDWCYISSGTWSLMGAELPSPVISPQTLANNFTNEGGVGGTIRFLKNIMGLWLVQECRRSLDRAGQSVSYADLTAQAASAPAFVAILNPDDARFMNPADMPTAVRDFCRQTGQNPPDEIGSLVRTCLEGLAFRYRWVKEQLEAHRGKPIRRIHIVGGGSQNRLLNQLAADACHCEIVAGPVEATALGNVVVQAMASGDIASLAEGRQVIMQSFPTEIFTPTPSSSRAWDDHYPTFLKLIGR